MHKCTGGPGGASTAATTKCGARQASHQQASPPPPSTRCPRTPQGRRLCPARAGGARHGGGGSDQPTARGTVKVIRRREIRVRGGGGGRQVGQEWVLKRGTLEPANRQGKEQHRHTGCGSHTWRDEAEHSRQGGGVQQGRKGNQGREPEWRGWESMRMGGSTNKGDGPASQPCRYQVPGQPLLNRHQVGGVSSSPDGLFAQQGRVPIRGRPAVRGKGTYGGRSGQCMEEQGTWASRTRKHSKADYGRPVDRGAWTAKTVK